MSQSLFAGETDYSSQSILDIKKDIVYWSSLCNTIKQKFEEDIIFLKKENMWEGVVPYNFRGFCNSIPKLCDTFSYDFGRVLEAIEENSISKSDINLLKNIYKQAHEFEQYCVDAYKHSGDYGWCDYGNPKFHKIEALYADGRDFLVTLFDVDNAAFRLEDYMKEDKIVDQSVHIGAEANVKLSGKHSQIGGNINKTEKKSLWEKFYLPLIIAIVAGVIVAIIAFCLKIN